MKNKHIKKPLDLNKKHLGLKKQLDQKKDSHEIIDFIYQRESI